MSKPGNTSPAAVFLSSVRTGADRQPDPVLIDLLDSVRRWAEKEGYAPWLFDDKGSSETWNSLGPVTSERVCLQGVDECGLFLGLYHTGYGSSSATHRARIGLTDLELFEAFRRGKPIRCYVVESGGKLDPHLETLLAIIQHLLPHGVSCRGTPSQVLDTIRKDIAQHFTGRVFASSSRASFRRFQHYLKKSWKSRHPLDRELGGFSLLSLDGASGTPSALHDVESFLIAADAEVDKHDARLPILLGAVHAMLDRPYFDTDDPRILEIWDRTLTAFEVSAAWRGLHGMLWNGRLPVLNSLLAIRAIRASTREFAMTLDPARLHDKQVGTKDEWLHLLSLGSALGSEYYSTAKLTSGSHERQTHLQRAMSWLTVAQRRHEVLPDPVWMAGVVSIRGHVRLALKESLAAIEEDFRLSVRLREQGGAGEHSIHEAKADLGYVCVLSSRTKVEGEKLLLEGVEGLERSMGAGFAARAKMKLAHFFARQGALLKAARQIREADAICELHGIVQREAIVGSQEDRFLAMLRTTTLGGERLRALATSNGYQFEKEMP